MKWRYVFYFNFINKCFNQSQVELTNNAKFVKLIPSLAGGIYKFDGQAVEPVPMTAEALLKASFKFADNTVMTGKLPFKQYST